MKKVFDKTFILYCIVGILNYIVCTAIMFILYNCGICSEDVAPLVNYGLGGIIWYVANIKLVFPGSKQTPGLVVRFIAEAVGCYIICYYILAPLLFKALVNSPSFENWLSSLLNLSKVRIEANCNMAFGSVLYAILNYFGQRFLVFNKLRKLKKLSWRGRKKAEEAEPTAVGAPGQAQEGTKEERQEEPASQEETPGER